MSEGGNIDSDTLLWVHGYRHLTPHWQVDTCKNLKIVWINWT